MESQLHATARILILNITSKTESPKDCAPIPTNDDCESADLIVSLPSSVQASLPLAELPSNPTQAPSLDFFAATNRPSPAYACNICGCNDCTFADPSGVVSFIYQNKEEKRPCALLQQEVENPTIYNYTYCRETIWREAYDVCSCYHIDYPDIPLSEIPGKRRLPSSVRLTQNICD